MDDSAEMIRQQMDDTRSQLSEKLESLESKVSDTVQSTSNSVSETVEAVKETVQSVTGSVQGAMQSVNNAFDVRGQVDRHPWLALGGAVALGCVAAHFLASPPRKKSRAKRSRRASHSRRPSPTAKATEQNGHRADAAPIKAKSRPAVADAEPKSWIWEQLGLLRGVAISSLMGVVRNLATRGLSEGLGQRVNEEVDHVTTKLGGDPIHYHHTNEAIETAHPGLATGQGARR